MKRETLAQAMERLGIKEADLEESFVASGGPGGQNVNKVATCVVLRHAPSGILIKCQQERSQAMNREAARRILVERIERRERERKEKETRRLAKIKRQNRRRSKAAKDKMLAAKKFHGRKKEYRRRVEED
ncbi:MAG TPA: peptide chain release factor-like protein [Verrucomicrobiae bacterium]|jgi:protein subunit release factor B|nr:peptide chain release factor-like protein [Verrucomicrobiae bacterium]